MSYLGDTLVNYGVFPIKLKNPYIEKQNDFKKDEHA